MKTRDLFKEFINSEKAGGILLVICTAISLLLANVFIGESYEHFWGTKIGGEGGKSIEYWVNDGLMAIFFLLIGLELKREVFQGKLSSVKDALLPTFAAIGGMIVPAGIYLLFNYGTETQSGAGIPMATDIAFALGALSLLGKRVPLSLKIFLTALAVIDDLGAILVIAIFYTKSLAINNLFIALGIFAALLILNRLKVKVLIIYLIGGGFMWYFMSISGIHPTIAGVLFAFTIPFGNGDEKTLSYKMQDFLDNPVTFIILPIFALVNTAIIIGGGFGSIVAQRDSIGIALGLIVGKPLGIFAMAYLCAKLGLVNLPSDLKWKNIFGVGILGGIGFTMSIFVTLLAFDDALFINNAKLIILCSSLVAGVIGFFVLKAQLKHREEPVEEAKEENLEGNNA